MSSQVRNPLLTRLGISLPIIQAPMAGVSTPAMAAAVSNAGGLGSLGVGATNAEGARKLIRETRALTDQPFNINLFCHPPAMANPARERAWLDYLAPEFAKWGAEMPTQLSEIYRSFLVDDDMLAMLLEEKPAVVSLHFGLPRREWIDRLKGAGIYLMATATNLEEAHRIAEAGVDAIVAQGVEAGGHRGMFDTTAIDEGIGTMALVRLIVRNTSLPVIAAGGIMDGAGIAAALALGAQAAQLGTAFVPTTESSADAAYRNALLSGHPFRTAFTSSISGRAARGIHNRLMALGETLDHPPVPDYPITYDAGKSLHAAAKAKGSADYAAQWAGQAAALARGMSSADLVALLAQELEDTVRGLRG